MTSRNIPSPGSAYSRSRNIRLRIEEDDALKRIAAATGQTPSQVLRQLLRIAATGAPDFVGDDKIDLRMLARQIAAIGRNLNQLVRSINRGEQVAPDDLRRVLNATRVQFTVVHQTYFNAVRAAVRRIVVPLCEEAGLRSPFEIEAAEGQLGRGSGQPPQQGERDPASGRPG